MYSTRSLRSMAGGAERTNPITGAGYDPESDRPRQGHRVDAPVPRLNLDSVTMARDSAPVVVKPPQANSTYNAIKSREKEAMEEHKARLHSQLYGPSSEYGGVAPLQQERGDRRSAAPSHGHASAPARDDRRGQPANAQRAAGAPPKDIHPASSHSAGGMIGGGTGHTKGADARSAHSLAKQSTSASANVSVHKDKRDSTQAHGAKKNGPFSSHAPSSKHTANDTHKSSAPSAPSGNRTAYATSGGKTVYVPSHPLYADPERERATELQMLEEALMFARDDARASIAADSSDSQLQKKLRLMEDAIASDELSNSLCDTPFVDPGPPPTRNDDGSRVGGRRGVPYESQFAYTGGLANAKRTATADQIFAPKVPFLARVVTKNGRDIHRELGGFFFVADGSVVVYEFRQFGQKTNVLPLFQRRVYRHPIGNRAGKPIGLSDVRVGNDLVFESALGRLPESMKEKPLVGFRVSEVDDAMRERLLSDFKARLSRSRDPALADIAGDIDLIGGPPAKKQMSKDEAVLEAARDQVRARIVARGGRGIVGIGRHFRSIDRNGDGCLDRGEFAKGLRDYGFKFDDKTLDVLFRSFDRDGSRTIEYDEFLRGVIGEMSEQRKSLVRKAFVKLDANKNGIIELDDIRKFYNAKRHPRVVSGECTEDEIMMQFLNVFDCVVRDGRVSYEEFEEYYEGVSMSIADDRYFALMMRNSWGVC
eukprot:Opistho-2@79522